MFVSHTINLPSSPRAYRDPSDPGAIWVTHGNNLPSCSYDLHEAQKLLAELTRELQAEAAYQASTGAKP